MKKRSEEEDEVRRWRRGVKSAVPATPVKSSGTRNEASVCSGRSFSTPATDWMESIDERSASCDTAIDSTDAKEDDEDDDRDVRTVMSETSEAAVVSAGRSGGSRSITRDRSETFYDMPGPDPSATRMTPVGTRPALNGDTPAANKVLGRCLELMKAKSEWMQLFSPKQVRQSIWTDLGGALATPINSTSTRQVAQNTVDLLRAMGCEPQILLTEAALASWTPTTAAMALTKWRKKFPVDPSKVPLPATPRKAATDDGVFAVKGDASHYMQDSHMITPRSTVGSERLARETEVSSATPGTRGATGRRSSRRYDLPDDSSDSDDDLGSDCYVVDLPSELARQVRGLSATDNQSSTPKLEITTHLPLCNIKSFFGTRDKSEHSMQWLRTFVYEMRGTPAPPNEWCMPFELKLRDGALYWFRQLPRKTRRTWKLLCEAFIKYYRSKFSQSAKARYYSAKRENKEHVCDYLNRLNGYARNAGVHFEHGDRDAKDHVEHFLVTCDDRDLEERLCHVMVKGIHDLEDMINDILRHRDRKSTRESSLRHSRIVVTSLRRSRSEDVTAVNLVDTLADVMAEWNIRGSVGVRNEASYAPRRDAEANEDYFEDERQYSDDQRSDEDSDTDYDSDEFARHVPAANDAERRAAADGTFARSDNRRFRNGGGSSNRERGVLAVCRVHDAGKCEALHELTKLLKSKVDKKDLSPELQSLLAEPAVDADYLFAFMGESKRPDDLKNNELVKPTENGEIRDAILVEIGIDEDDDDELRDHGRSLKVRGINPGVMKTQRRALVKIPLGAGVDVVLGMTFIIPAGIRLDLFYGTARLPDEVMDLIVPGRELREFRLPRQRLSRSEYDVWVRRTDKLVPTVMRLRRGQPTWVRLTNITAKAARCTKHDSVVLWVPHGELPRETGYARLDSNKYKEWQVLAFSTSRDETLLGRERRIYEQWLAEQPPAAERRTYPMPRKILTRPPDAPNWPRGRQLAPMGGGYSSPHVHGYGDASRVCEGSVGVAQAGAGGGARSSVPNESSDDEPVALDVAEAHGEPPLYQPTCTSARLNDGEDDTDQRAVNVSAEALEAIQRRNQRHQMSYRQEPLHQALVHLKHRLRTHAAEADTDFQDFGDDSIDDPEPLLETTYISVMHAMVAEESIEDDAIASDVSEHTLNEISLIEYAQALLPTPRLMPTTRIWPYMERGNTRQEC
ncbi:hypothetical protein PHYSODRAFT_320802 [Phytophthora sojae]|uniref:Retrotransposon gag domain-containing protein n=1 Tax=Phytophthora sojae (strain P6497) TaxID=1094619 RepID=G4YET9_PHYSP|nr:hypothetical protein PHYSODRAFT_320802 [Phytophthora sojae]EGZ26933.1 hypothetical protein PHYSODRAFT_320802 [Phytophthora sojae]|eukprot:XP_009514208.1 hypothetical protein PHYSODRAFT_320802 [Phytophthora sojae]